MDSGSLSEHKKTVGLKESLKAIKKDSVETVFIAKDAEARVVSDVISLCQEKGIPIVEAESMEALGKACSIQVGTAVAVRLKD